jgi:hypothetical protein
MRSSFLLPGQKPFESRSSISIQWQCPPVYLLGRPYRSGQPIRCSADSTAESQKEGVGYIPIPAPSCVNHVIAGRNGSGLSAEIHSPAMVRGTI